MAASPDREKALEAALAQIDKQYGKGAVMKLGAEAVTRDIPVIPTGCLTLDAALGQQLRIAVELNSSVLHSIRATARPFIAQRQTGFGAPYGLAEN